MEGVKICAWKNQGNSLGNREGTQSSNIENKKTCKKEILRKEILSAEKKNAKTEESSY